MPTANQRIARAAGTVAAALLFGNLVNLVSLILNAAYFDAKTEMDAFMAANRVSETIFTLMAGGALGSAFIPTFTGLLAKKQRETAWKLASAIANLALIVLITVAALAVIFARPLVRYLLAPGFANDPATMTLTVNMMRIMLPAAVLFGLSGLVMGILNSHQVFFVPALTPAFYRLGMIFGVLVLSPRLGIYGLAWGVVIGAALHLLLQIPSLLRLKGDYAPTLGLKLAPVREVALLMGPRLFGVAAVQINFWVNIILASYMPDGSLSAVGWGLTIMLMPQAAIAQAAATAAMPTLAAQYALGQLDEVRRSIAASLRGVLLLALPASLGLILLNQPIVALMMEYGNFTPQSTQMVAWALLWYAAGLVGHFLVEILARAYYALHDTLIPVLVGAAAMGLNIALSFLLTDLFARLGLQPHGGLALANSLATALEALVLLALMRRRLNGLHGKTMLAMVGQAGLATLAMAAAVWGWLALMGGRAPWITALGGAALGGAAFGGVAFLLGVAEIRHAWRLVTSQLRKAP